jgi:predicted lipid-binding transport protein (Tim44 family)
MKRFVVALCLLAAGALVAAQSEAARLGGGRSMGTQRSVTRAPSATPAKPAQQQAAPAQNPAAAQPQPSGLSRWMPLLGGLAIGGLLGSLFGGGGFGGFGGILLLALLVFATVALVKAFMRRAEAPRPAQYAGIAGERVSMPAAEDAARAPAAATAGTVPEGFDTASFLKGAKLNFVKLQLANDLGQLEEIREFTTNEMFDELKRDAPAPGQQTDIIGLDADLLQVATEGGRHWASVRFSGRVRETPQAAPEGFEEVWNLVKPADGSTGWLLAGIQQLH